MDVAHADPVAALVARVERRAEELARTVARTWQAEIPDAAALLDDAVAHQSIRTLLAGMRDESPPSERLRQESRALAARPAERGLPLGTLLAAHAICTRVTFDALRQTAQPQQHATLIESAARLVKANAQITDDVARSYHNELAGPGTPRHARHRALVRDLLTGIVPSPAALRESELVDGAVVLAVSFSDGPAASEESASNGSAIEPCDRPPGSAVRSTGAVQATIDGYFGRALPALFEADGGHVLVPHALMPAPQGASLDEIAARITEIRPDARVAAVPAHSPAAVPEAARTASEVLRLAGRLGRPSGAHRLADVMLEYHLTRRDASAGLLDGLLAPLAERPELLETVRVYLEENHDRRRAAQRLSLHPNTVDNRLARTTELTGLDPATPRGVTLLLTALALRDLG